MSRGRIQALLPCCSSRKCQLSQLAQSSSISDLTSPDIFLLSQSSLSTLPLPLSLLSVSSLPPGGSCLSFVFRNERTSSFPSSLVLLSYKYQGAQPLIPGRLLSPPSSPPSSSPRPPLPPSVRLSTPLSVLISFLLPSFPSLPPSVVSSPGRGGPQVSTSSGDEADGYFFSPPHLSLCLSFSFSSSLLSSVCARTTGCQDTLLLLLSFSTPRSLCINGRPSLDTSH